MSKTLVELLVTRGADGKVLLNRQNIPDALELLYASLDPELATYCELSAADREKALVDAPPEDATKYRGEKYRLRF